MNQFFSQQHCDRCHRELRFGRTMSMYNEECICIDCSTKEGLEADYDKARDAEVEEIKKGNYNYRGIGRKMND